MMRRRSTLSLLICAAILIGSCVACSTDTAADKRVSIDAKNLPLGEVIDMLFKGTGLSYTLDPQVGHLMVTMVLKDVPFDVALTQVVKAAGAVYRVEGNVYTISTKPMGGYPAGPGAPMNVSAEHMTSVRLKYLTPGELMPIVSRNPQVIVTVTGPNTLMLAGKQDDVMRVVEMISSLDTESALLRVINIKLVATETGGSEPLVNELNIGAVEGQQAHAQVSSKIRAAVNGRTAQHPDAVIPVWFAAQVTPIVKDDGQICLTVWVDYSRGPDAKQSTTTTRCLEPGKPVVVAGFTRTGEGSGETKFELTATATLSGERVPPIPLGPMPAQSLPGGPGFVQGTGQQPPFVQPQPGIQPGPAPQPGAPAGALPGPRKPGPQPGRTEGSPPSAPR